MSITESIKDGVIEGIKGYFSWIGKKIFFDINDFLDTAGLILVLTTWLMYIMSVPNAGKWCYIIFAFYIVGKVVLKAICLL